MVYNAKEKWAAKDYLEAGVLIQIMYQLENLQLVNLAKLKKFIFENEFFEAAVDKCVGECYMKLATMVDNITKEVVDNFIYQPWCTNRIEGVVALISKFIESKYRVKSEKARDYGVNTYLVQVQQLVSREFYIKCNSPEEGLVQAKRLVRESSCNIKDMHNEGTRIRVVTLDKTVSTGWEDVIGGTV